MRSSSLHAPLIHPTFRQTQSRPTSLSQHLHRHRNHDSFLTPQKRTHAASPPPSAMTASSAAMESSVTLMRVATGVPLLNIFTEMPLLDCYLQSALLIGTAVIIVCFGNEIIGFLSSKLEAALNSFGSREHIRRKPLAQFLATCIAAGERPAQALLPWYGFTFVSTVIATLADVTVARFGHNHESASTMALMHSACMYLVDFLRDAAQLMQDASEIVLVVFATWFFLNLKSALVDSIMKNASAVASMDDDNLARLVYPISTLISWATVTGSVLFSLNVAGINVKPILALGSVSTLAIGFAAQSVVSNIVSAFSLYTSRPFIAGDRVCLKTMSGSVVVTGTVEKIMPMHTVFKTDTGTPIFVHNKDVASSLLVVNESRFLKSATTPQLPTLDTTITIRYKDVDIVPVIQEEVTAWMKSHPDMLPGASCKCALVGFNKYGAEMSVKCTMKRESDARKAKVIMDVLLFVENTVRRHGGYLAMDEGVELPPQRPPAGSPAMSVITVEGA